VVRGRIIAVGPVLGSKKGAWVHIGEVGKNLGVVIAAIVNRVGPKGRKKERGPGAARDC